jgi:hypothetical protein
MIRKGSYVSQQAIAESKPKKLYGERVYGRWPKSHELVLAKLYQTYTAEQLAVHFHRKRQDIKNKLFRLGLKKSSTVSINDHE